jgi:hypothetical protein
MLVIITATLLLLGLEGRRKAHCCWKQTNEHTRANLPRIEAHQNTVRVISLRQSLHAHARLTLHSWVQLLILASKHEILSEDT